MIFTVGVFAFKSALGLYYFLSQEKENKTRILFFAGFSLVYGILFMLSAYMLHNTPIIRYVSAVQHIAASGMFIHILMAALLLIWGIFLLKTGSEGHSRSRGWLALVIPCPVCMLTVFFTAGFVSAFFPDSGYWAVFLAYKGFMLTTLLTLIVLFALGRSRWFAVSPDTLLANGMIMIAAYFFLSVIIMPQFADLDKVYRLAEYKGKQEGITAVQTVFLYSTITVLFLSGFCCKTLTVRRKEH